MSTEHQQYSTENQGDKIKEYAARNDIEIVRTYADEGKSGLNIGGLDLSRIYAAPAARLGCLAFEGQGAFASQS
jgi:hypothetical protein